MTIKPQDFFGATPNTVLNKPMFHVQDKVAIGTAPQTFSTGLLQRNLNTVIVNQISGAALVSNGVSLPAGTYYVEGHAAWSVGAAGDIGRVLITDGNNNILLQSLNRQIYYSGYGIVSGNITLATTGSIKLQQRIPTSTGAVNGVLLNNTDSEVYSDLKIWQLDTTVKTPVLSSNSLYPLPGTSFVEGDMYGLEYARTGNNQVTVQPGICMDSLNTTLLSLAAQQVVNLAATVNGLFYLFLCNDGVVRSDTDVNGANLSAYKIRWIGYVPNNSSGVVKGFAFKGGFVNEIWFDKFTDNVINSQTAPPAGLSTAIDISSFIPVSRVSDISIGAQAVTTVNTVTISTISGTEQGRITGYIANNGYGDSNEWGAAAIFIRVFSSNIYWGFGTYTASGTIQFAIHAVKLRR